MTKNVVTVLGVVFVLIGILGFIPGVTPDNELLGIFAVNGLHNVVHLLSGIAALAAVAAGGTAPRMYAQVFGLVYALVTILGFIMGTGELLSLVLINQADNFLHLVITVVLLYVGFSNEDAPQRANA